MAKRPSFEADATSFANRMAPMWQVLCKGDEKLKKMGISPHVLLKWNTDTLVAVGTNLDTGIYFSTDDIDVIEPATDPVSVESLGLYQVSRSLSGRLRFTILERKFKIESPQGRINISQGADTELSSKRPVWRKGCGIKLDAERLAQAIARTEVLPKRVDWYSSMSPDKINVWVDGSYFYMANTDGAAAVASRIPIREVSGDEVLASEAVVVYQPVLQAVTRAMSAMGELESVWIQVSEEVSHSSFYLVSGNDKFLVWSALVEDQPVPGMHEILGTKPDFEVTVNREEFDRAFKAASTVFRGSEAKVVDLNMEVQEDSSDHRLRVVTRGEVAADADIAIPCAVRGDLTAESVPVMATYIQSILRLSRGEEVVTLGVIAENKVATRVVISQEAGTSVVAPAS